MIFTYYYYINKKITLFLQLTKPKNISLLYSFSILSVFFLFIIYIYIYILEVGIDYFF